MKNFLKNLKEKINNYLEKMAEANKKSYGSGKLDCCDLNKKKNTNGTRLDS